MVFPTYLSISHGEDTNKKTRVLKSRVREFNEEDMDPKGFNVFINALPGTNFKPVALSQEIHKEFPPPDHLIKIFYLSKSKLKINCKSAVTANKLIKNNKFLVSYNIQIPHGITEVKGRVPIDCDCSEQYIYDNLKVYNENGDSSSNPKLLEVYRIMFKDNLKKDNSFIASNNVILTFQGNKLPRFVELDQLIIPVFVQLESVRQCQRCWRYGHSKNGCRAINEICGKCGEKSHDSSSVCIENCVNCKQPHSANSKICQVFLNRKNINFEKSKSIMRLNAPQKVVEPFAYSEQDFPSLEISHGAKKKKIMLEKPSANPQMMLDDMESNSSSVDTISNASLAKNRKRRSVMKNSDTAIQKNLKDVTKRYFAEHMTRVFQDVNWINQVIVNLSAQHNITDASNLLHTALNTKIINYFTEFHGTLDPSDSV